MTNKLNMDMGLRCGYRWFCTLCREICSSILVVWVPMGSELASLFSVAASHSIKGTRVSWNCCATTKIFSNCFCLPKTLQLVLCLNMNGFVYTVQRENKVLYKWQRQIISYEQIQKIRTSIYLESTQGFFIFFWLHTQNVIIVYFYLTCQQ